jgi:hypothetical protein
VSTYLRRCEDNWVTEGVQIGLLSPGDESVFANVSASMSGGIATIRWKLLFQVSSARLINK